MAQLRWTQAPPLCPGPLHVVSWVLASCPKQDVQLLGVLHPWSLSWGTHVSLPRTLQAFWFCGHTPLLRGAVSTVSSHAGNCQNTVRSAANERTRPNFPTLVISMTNLAGLGARCNRLLARLAKPPRGTEMPAGAARRAKESKRARLVCGRAGSPCGRRQGLFDGLLQ